MRQKNTLQTLFLIFTISLIASSCDFSKGSDLPNLQPTNIDVNTYEPKTQVNLPTQTIIIEPTTATTETQSYLATLPYSEAQKKIKEIWETNGSCNFPCWFGITPGISTMNDLYMSIVPISGIVEMNAYNDGAWVEIPYQELPEKKIRFFFRLSGDKVEEIKILTHQNLRNILLKNGMPTQIWVYMKLAGYFDVVTFSFVVYYQQLNLVVEYLGQEPVYANYSDQFNVRLCSDLIDKNYFGMYLFPKEIIHNETDLFTNWDLGRAENFDLHKKIGEVSNMTVETFYNNFLMASPDQCFLSSLDFWK